MSLLKSAEFKTRIFGEYSIKNSMAKLERISKSHYIKILAHIAILLTMCAWGTSFISTKVLMVDGGLTPVEVYIYRFVMAYILLLLLTFRQIKSHNWKDELQLMLCGMCAGSLYFVTENYALKYTTTGNVSLLGSISPIFTTILISVIYKTRMKPGVILGSVIAFIGVGSIVFSNGDSIEIRPAGDLLALSASMSWAIYAVAIRRLSPIYSSLFITRKLFLYGVLTALPLLFIQDEPMHLAVLFDFTKPQFGMNFMFLVIFCSVCAYIIYNECMKILGSVMASNYLYLQPLVTMVAGYFIFDEIITPLGYIGCVLIIGGLVISDKLKWDLKKYR